MKELNKIKYWLFDLDNTLYDGATKVFDADSALTDTAISGAYIDEIFFRYTKRVLQTIDAVTAPTATYSAINTTCTVTLGAGHNLEIGQNVFLDFKTSGLPTWSIVITFVIFAQSFRYDNLQQL